MKQNKVPKNQYINGEPSPYRKNPYKDDVLYTQEGQWKYPGQITRIPGGDITMAGVPYPVYGEDNLGYSQMMYPGMDYTFPGQYVTEVPMAAYGGDPSLPALTGHYPFGGQYTKTHTHFAKGGVATDDSLRTWDLGDYEGQPETEKMKDLIKYHEKNPDEPVPGGETFNDFKARVIPGFNKLLQELPNKALVVTHSHLGKIPELGLAKLEHGHAHPVQVGGKTIYIAYHGHTPQNDAVKTHPDEIRSKNVPLANKGVKEAKKLGDMMKDKNISEIVSSPLPRALQTAEIIKDKLKTPKKKYGGWLNELETGGWLDELDQEYRKGGAKLYTPLALRVKAAEKGTSKNIQSSINKIFLRNYDIFGPSGRNVYNPNSKYQDGGKTWGDMSYAERKSYLDAKEANKKAEDLSREQARKEYYKDWVAENYHEGAANPMFMTLASFTPWGLPSVLGSSAVGVGSNLANKQYLDAAIDASMLLPAGKTVGKGAKKVAEKVKSANSLTKDLKSRVIMPSKTMSTLPEELEPYISKINPSREADRFARSRANTIDEYHQNLRDAIIHLDKKGNIIPNPEKLKKQGGQSTGWLDNLD